MWPPAPPGASRKSNDANEEQQVFASFVFGRNATPDVIDGFVVVSFGSAFVLMTYRDAIIEFYSGDDDRDWEMDTAGIFVTSPAKGISNVLAAIDQVCSIGPIFLSSMTLLFHPAPDADCWHRAAVAGSLRYWIFQERRSVI